MATRTSASPTIELSTGAVRGTVVDGIARYLGVPFAAPPFGENRFAKPRPHQPWSGVRDADSLGPTPPQAPYTNGSERFLPSVRIGGDEILNVNIWTPLSEDGSPRRGLPVMVWFYGGALTRGCNALQTYDGTAFARDGVVLVVPNYRVGAEGFSVLRGAPRNLGLADQLAALRWVQAEIAKFGGDAGRVTIFGQSAGGGTVAALLALPEAPQLFSGAIVQSAPLGPRGKPRKRTLTDTLAHDLGVAPTRDAFMAIPPDQLVAAQTRAMARTNPVLGEVSGYSGELEEETMPVDPWAAFEAGAGAGIPVIVGYTAEEYRLWFVPSGMMRQIRWWLVVLAMLRFRVRPRTIRAYRRRGCTTPAEIVGMLATDMLVRLPAYRFADLRRTLRGQTFVYEFAWRSPVDDLGAAHAVDVAFAFDNLHCNEARMISGSAPPQALADRMHAAWVRFATTGDPGWPAWDETRPMMVFDHPEPGVQHAQREPRA